MNREAHNQEWRQGEREKAEKTEAEKNVAIPKRGGGGRNEILRVGDVICSSCNQDKNPSYVPPKVRGRRERSKAGQLSGLDLLNRDIPQQT